MKYGLGEDVVANVQGVFSKYPQVRSAILYGSRAKGEYRNGSDVDLTLHGSELDIHLLAKISNEIDDLLMPYKFDLSVYNDIDNSDLLDHIERVGVIFYKGKR